MINSLAEENDPPNYLKRILAQEVKFSFLMSRPQSIQRDEAYYTAFSVYRGIADPCIISIPLEESNRAIYLETTFLEKVIKHLADKVSTRKEFIKHQQHFGKIEGLYSEATRVFTRLNKNKEVLLVAYRKYIELVKEISDFAWMPFSVENVFAPKLIALLKANYPSSFEAKYQAVTCLTRLNAYQKMRIAICNAHIEDSEKNAIKALVKDYYWYGEYSFVEDLYDEKYFANEIAKLTKEKAVEEKTRITSEIEKNKANFEETRGQIKDENLLLFADIANEYAYLRTARVDLFKKLLASARPIFELTAKLLKEETGENWNRNEVVKLLEREIIDYLSGRQLPDFDNIASRANAVYYRSSKEAQITTNPALIKKIVSVLQPKESEIIKGTIVFKGIVKGIAVVVLSKNDLYKVTPNSILVARTTMPDYTPALEKVAAFVTEEGGITSHAAIIAREFKKPCIVGTGNCTKLIKDGDLIEVDATKGIVRIIKNSRPS